MTYLTSRQKEPLAHEKPQQPQERHTEKDPQHISMPVIYFIVFVSSMLARMFRGFYSDGNTPIFDEKHYAVHAWEMTLNGGVENNFGYNIIVHPPLGKYLIALGEVIFGNTPVGWRIFPMIAGSLTVVLITAIAYRLTRSQGLAISVALLATFDAVLLSVTRLALLDSFTGLFMVLIVYCLLRYFQDQDGKVNIWEATWLAWAGVAGGLMMSVKVSGVYPMAFAGLTLVMMTLLRVEQVRDMFINIGMGLVYFLVVPVTVFFVSYTPWFASESSVYRHAIESGEDPVAGTGWMPLGMQNFFYYYSKVMEFHTGLTTRGDNFFPYESKWWEWMLGARPMLLKSDESINARYDIVANPLMWGLLGVVFLFSVYKVFTKRFDWAVVLFGLSSAWIPWIMFTTRQQYLFYCTTVAPFLALGIVMLIRELATAISRGRIEKNNQGTEEDNDEDEKVSLTVDEVRVTKVFAKVLKNTIVTYMVIAGLGFMALTPAIYGIPGTAGYVEKVKDTMPRWETITEDNLYELYPSAPESNEKKGPTGPVEFNF